MSQPTITYKGEKMSIMVAINLITIASKEEANELISLIEKISPSQAIRVRKLRELTLEIESFRKQSNSDNSTGGKQ